MRLTRDIALVGGGNNGFNLSAALDCHIYLLDGGDELALIDAGIGDVIGGTETILANIRDDGFNTDRISRLILTHYHADHAGGAAELREALGLTVVGSPLTAKTMETADIEAISLPFAQAAGFYPKDYRFKACPCKPTLHEGQPFTVGRLKVTPFETPGHCRGHISLLIEGGDRAYFVGGDLIFWGGTIIAQNIHDCSIQEYADSTHKVAKLDFDALLPGHFAISLRDGKRHIDAAEHAFNQLMIPRNAL